MNATKRPWKMQEDGTTYKRWNIVSEDPTWGLIAHIRGPRTHPEVSENAKLIVRAVNSYDAMREALEVMKDEKEILAEKLAKLEKELAFYKAKNGDASVCHACDGTGWVYG